MANGLSSLGQYKSVLKNYDRVVTQFEKDPQYKQSVKLIREAGPDINNVDAFLKNRRALQVALSAFQLEDQIDSVGVLRKLLTQDPSDPKSVANRLSDPRYLSFAKAFADLKNNVSVLKPTSVEDSMVKAYQQSSDKSVSDAKANAALNSTFFRLFAKDINSPDGLVSDPKSLKVALGSYGINDLNDAVTIRKLLNEDPLDPASFAQTSKDGRYIAFAKGLAGLKDGTKIWDNPGNLELTLINYADNLKLTLDAQGKTATKNIKHFTDNAASYTSVDKLLADPVTLKMVVAAFGVDTTLSSAGFLKKIGVDTGSSTDFNDFLGKILAQNPDDPQSLVNRLTDKRYLSFASMLATSGTGLNVLTTPAGQQEIADKYMARWQGAITAQGNTILTNVGTFNSIATNVQSVTDLVNNKTLSSVALGAYGISDLTDTVKITQLLSEDPDDPTSLAQTSGDARYLAFAQGLKDLKNGTAIWADPTFLANTAQAYSTAANQLLAGQIQTLQDNIQHFKDNSNSLTSVSGLLADKDSLQVILMSFGMEKSASDPNGWQPPIGDEIYKDKRVTAFLKTIITDDPANTKATLNQKGNEAFKTFTTSLQGLTKGTAIFTTSKKLEDLVSAFRINEFEKHEGETDPALREALYFKRNAGGLTSVFQIIGNKPLYHVVRVALGLPDQVAALDAKQQKRTLEKRLDMTKFSDPAYIDKLIQRFLSNSDAKDTSNASPTLGLFDGSASGGTSNTSGGIVSLLA